MTKKLFTSTAAAFMLLTNFSYAGGDIAPQEPEMMMPETIDDTPVVVSNNYFYTGLGYSYMNMNNDTLNTDITGNAVTFLAGYKFYQYLALEGRYSLSVSDLDVDGTNKNWDMSNVALYLKPQYALDQVTVYGLLGYGEVTLDNGTSYSENGFQWGLGASYSVSDSIDLFVDYTRLYDDNGFDTFTTNDKIIFDSVNVGVNYKF